MGRLEAALPPGPEGRWDRGNVIELTLFDGSLTSATRLAVLAGANRIAIEGAQGWEVIQFADAELIAPGRWRLTTLLRGLGGSPSGGVQVKAHASSCWTTQLACFPWRRMSGAKP